MITKKNFHVNVASFITLIMNLCFFFFPEGGKKPTHAKESISLPVFIFFLRYLFPYLFVNFVLLDDIIKQTKYGHRCRLNYMHGPDIFFG